MKKKALKIVGIIVLVIIAILIAIPFFLEGKIGDIIKNNVNKNVNATFDFEDADLSLLASFPNAEVSLEGVTLINKAPFEGDTLFAANEVALKMGIGELFKGEDDPIGIQSLVLNKALLNITVDEQENASYDVALETEEDAATADAADADASEGFQLDLQSYEISDARIVYDDRAAGMRFEISEMQHEGSGDLSLDKSELQTMTNGLVSFEMDSTNYLNKNKVQLDALIGVNLTENKYSFLKNEALVNQLPLVFEGFVKLNDDETQEVDISFKTPSSDFKNFLAVIPEEYSKNIEDVETSGDFVVAGEFKGIVDETRIPKFNIAINSDNASFKYPDLPKSVTNINIDTKINNDTGIAEDTYVNIDKLSFNIEQDKFNMNAKIRELLGNTKVNAHVDGNMNLANLSKAYPVPADLNLKGLLTADITTAFDMASIEKEQYGNTQTQGQLSLREFEYNSEDFANPIKLSSTAVTFNPKTVTLEKLDGTTGQTDFSAKGTIDNLLGYMFNDENVKGNFDLSSNTFALNDFMVEETENPSSEEDGADAEEPKSDETSDSGEEKIKVPAFLDVTINASANKVLYDNLTLSDVKGTLRIQDETVTLSNLTSSIFDGKMAMNGKVSTKQETPTFDMKLDMSQLQIGETFKSLELFKALAPIAQVLQGKLNSDISLSGNLTDDLLPDLMTLSGNILANVMTEKIDTEKAPLLSALDSKLNFIDLDQLNLKDLKTSMNFENGLVSVKPFTFNYKDIAINVGGSHTFDKKLDYKATMDVPAKYLGGEVNKLMSQIGEDDLENLTIPVIANIGGDYTSPNVTTDLTSGVKSLTGKLVEIQKQKAINKGKDKVKDLIGDALGGSTSEDGSADGSNKKKDAKEILGGLLGNQEKDSVSATKDSIPAKKEDKEVVKEKAKNILGGLLGNKKKDSTN